MLFFTLTFYSFCQSNSWIEIKEAKAFMIDGNYQDAISILNSLILNDSSNTDALYYLGLNFQALSNFNKAAGILYQAVRIKPNDSKLLYSLGDNYFSSGLINQADTVLTKANSIDPGNIDIQILLAKVLINEKQWLNAASIYSLLIAKDTSNSYFYEQAAKCQSEFGNIDQAISLYITANRLNPRNLNTTLELSYLLYLKKKYYPAIMVVNNGLKYYGLTAILYSRKADIYMKLEDYTEAVVNYNAALFYGDTSAENYKNIGISLYWKGLEETTANDFHSAINFLEHSAEINPKDAVTYFYLGALYKGFKEYSKSLNYFIKASEILKDPFLGNTYVQIGAVYQLEGKFKNALENYQYALQENPSDKSTLFYIGNSYDKLKNNKMALFYFKKFIKESPNGDKKLLVFAKSRIEALK